MKKLFVFLLLPCVFACTKKAAPPATELAPASAAVPTTTTAKPGELPAGALGAVYLEVAQQANHYRLKIVFPNEQVDGTNSPSNQDDTPYTARNYPVKLAGAIALYDAKGLLGTLKAPAHLLGVFWCENDGGSKYRPEFTVEVPKSELQRAPVAADGESKIVALAMVDEKHDLAPLKFAAPANAKVTFRHDFKIGAAKETNARILVWDDAGEIKYGPYVGIAMRGTYLPLTCDGP